MNVPSMARCVECHKNMEAQWCSKKTQACGEEHKEQETMPRVSVTPCIGHAEGDTYHGSQVRLGYQSCKSFQLVKIGKEEQS